MQRHGDTAHTLIRTTGSPWVRAVCVSLSLFIHPFSCHGGQWECLTSQTMRHLCGFKRRPAVSTSPVVTAVRKPSQQLNDGGAVYGDAPFIRECAVSSRARPSPAASRFLGIREDFQDYNIITAHKPRMTRVGKWNVKLMPAPGKTSFMLERGLANLLYIRCFNEPSVCVFTVKQ